MSDDILRAAARQARAERADKLPKAIRLRANGKYIAEPSYKGLRDSRTVNTLEEAITAREEILLHLKAQYEAQQNAVNGGWSYKEAYERTHAARWRGKVSEKNNRLKYEEFCGFLESVGLPRGDTPVRKITTELVDKFTDWLVSKSDADATINRKYSHLSTILKVAHKRGHIDRMPEITKREELNNRIRFLTVQEEHEVLNRFIHLDKGKHAVCLALLIDMGFRPDELWRLEASQVNLTAGTRGTISIWKTKTRKPRTLPMTGRVREIVLALLRLRPKGLLLPSTSNDWFSNGWDRVRTLMRLTSDKDFVPYCLRHTCCSRLVQRGTPLNHVQQWMGHSTILTTMRYAHLAPHDLFALAEVLEQGEHARWSSVVGDQMDPEMEKKAVLPPGMTYTSLTEESWRVTD